MNLTSTPTRIRGGAAQVLLNDIQIASATKIIESVSGGEVPRESGINQLKVFLGLTDEQAEQVMGDAGTGKIIKKDKVINKYPAPKPAEV